MGKTALTITLTLTFVQLGWTETDPDMRARMNENKETVSFNKMIDDSAEVYRTITAGEHGRIHTSVTENARCIAVLPSVLTGALIVGGTHGNGIASCKNSIGAWSHPAAISLNQGSLGLQAGAKSTDLVLFFQSQDAESALKRGNFMLGTDVSAVAGKFDTNLDPSNAGVIVYSRTEGVFAGVSVNGSRIGQDEDGLAKYYDKKVDYLALLEGDESPDTTGYTKKFTSLLP